MRAVSAASPDLATPAPAPTSALDRRLAALILDPRDLPFLYLMMGCLATAVVGVTLFFSGPWLWYLAPFYWALVFLGFGDRFILMLHCTSHRQLFKPQYRKLNLLIPWVLGPFFGETPETYFVHHMGMHHPENNLADDLSSTMRYRRDNLAHWLHYLGSFLSIGPALLGVYHWRKNNKKMLSRMLSGELSFYVLVALLAVLNWRATFVVFVFPVLLVRTVMMMGNWAQHSFIDASDAANPYRNSITCINTRYNRRCFNDGYHVGHHLRANRHWTELPADFMASREMYARDGALVFEGIDFFMVSVLLWTRQYRMLARRFVRLGRDMTDDEVVALLRSRVHPVPVWPEHARAAAAA